MKIHVAPNESGTREIWAVRDDGAAVQVATESAPDSLPHELFHYVVEDALALQWGYWDCIARGALFAGMGVRGGIERDDALKLSGKVGQEAGPRADDAEFFVAAVETAIDGGHEHDVEAAKAGVRKLWPHLETPALETADLAAIKQRVAEMTKRWLDLGTDELTLPWPSADAGALRVSSADRR